MLELDLAGASFRETGVGLLVDSRAATRTCGILVVDDDASVRGMLSIVLKQQGFAVWLAADGQEALALYKLHRLVIDVVLMDVRMPRLDGPRTLTALQQLNPRICCRFMSGDLGNYTEWKLSSLSSAAVIRKPFPLPEVAQMLWELAQKVNLQPC
ncbi:MAG: response regulator [Gemmataceae bacterium]|nr:response regulator [Gemmataceae bacterium]